MASGDLAERVLRWAMAIQEHDFDVQYRPHCENIIADTLSAALVAALHVADRRTKDVVLTVER